MDDQKENMPLFIKVENYEEIKELMDMIKKKVEESKDYLERIYELKKEEDKTVEEWDNILHDLEKKIEFIDDKLVEPGM